MKHNMGNADRLIRVIIALVIGTLYFMNMLAGVWAYILLAVAAVFIITSFIGSCPLYSLLGINTCSKKYKKSPGK